MKLLVIKETGRVVFAFPDDKSVVLKENTTLIGDPLEFDIFHLNSSNAAVYENITLPEDWVMHRYLFDGINWTVDPNYERAKSEEEYLKANQPPSGV
jgi:hypothetical protein